MELERIIIPNRMIPNGCFLIIQQHLVEDLEDSRLSNLK